MAVRSDGQAESRWKSGGVLSARGRDHPWVFARLPDREVRRWKTRVGEGTDRHRHNVGRRIEHVVQGRAALGTEVVRPRLALVGNPDVFARVSRDVDEVARKPRLKPERATRPALARKARPLRGRS